MIATTLDVENYYRANKDKFIFYFSQRVNSDHCPRAEEMAQDVFVALLKAILEHIPIKMMDRYAWGVARNKLRMLYRSKDWRVRKSLYHESINPQSYDEDALCDLMDGVMPEDE